MAREHSRTANREWVLLRRPAASGATLNDFELLECPMPQCAEGHIVLRCHLMSVDPAMRTMMAGGDLYAENQDKFGISYYSGAWKVGGNPSGRVIAVVVESKAPGFVRGDLVRARLPWKLVQSVPSDLGDPTGRRRLERLDAISGVDAASYLGVLGGTGLAGFLPIAYLANAKQGEVAFVSAAAGATGMTAAQTLRNLGCVVIGSAGTDEKCARLEKMGILAVNYNKKDLLLELKRLAPNGLDIYFDNGEKWRHGIACPHALTRVWLAW
eukprot:COSAG01_NODE_8280_length_2846_cov_2.831452_1_plen_269_part_00